MAGKWDLQYHILISRWQNITVTFVKMIMFFVVSSNMTTCTTAFYSLFVNGSLELSSADS